MDALLASGLRAKILLGDVTVAPLHVDAPSVGLVPRFAFERLYSFHPPQPSSPRRRKARTSDTATREVLVELNCFVVVSSSASREGMSVAAGVGGLGATRADREPMLKLEVVVLMHGSEEVVFVMLPIVVELLRWDGIFAMIARSTLVSFASFDVAFACIRWCLEDSLGSVCYVV